MSPQLTLQTPLRLPPVEVKSYLEQLWENDHSDSPGANTFCLLIWQPAWVEQQLARTARLSGPIIGTQREELIQAIRKVILEEDLPHCTSALDPKICNILEKYQGSENAQDLRGQHVDSAISALQPRRLITLAPTLGNDHDLETLVAAYCPLPEEGGEGESACGDVVVLKGDVNSLNKNLNILEPLLPSELPSWLWWDGSLDEATDLLNQLSTTKMRLIVDSALGDPSNCLNLLNAKINSGQAVNDLNWLRLRTWRETLAMVFDPPNRRNALNNVVQLDIDIEGEHPVQGLLLASWIADRLGWILKDRQLHEGKIIKAIFERATGGNLHLNLMPLPLGNPSIHPGQIVGLRLICDPEGSPNESLCVILGAQTGECMRLEAGGMARMELLEEVVPNQSTSTEMDVARLLSSSRGRTSPLLEAAAPIASKLLAC